MSVIIALLLVVGIFILMDFVGNKTKTQYRLRNGTKLNDPFTLEEKLKKIDDHKNIQKVWEEHQKTLKKNVELGKQTLANKTDKIRINNEEKLEVQKLKIKRAVEWGIIGQSDADEMGRLIDDKISNIMNSIKMLEMVKKEGTISDSEIDNTIKKLISKIR